MPRTLTIACLTFLLLGASPAGYGAEIHVQKNLKTAQAGAHVPDEIIVKFEPGVSDATIRQINRRNGTSIIESNKQGGFKVLKIPAHKTVAEMVAVYSHNPNIEYAEPNFIAEALFVPNDTYYSPYQWHFDNNVYGGIGMEEAWDLEMGDPSVIVAIIDTGVAYENYGSYSRAPDLANTVFVPGYDYINYDTHPNDDNGHGTHVCGTIAQNTNNNMGVAGIAPGTAVMPVKVLSSSGSGSYASVANGIYYAADHGADVINMSLGGTSSSFTLHNALIYAANHGVTIACAAGNGYQSGNAANYPAVYNECIAVAATRFDNTHSYYSNTGSYVDIAAPGGDTTVDQNGDGYGDGVLQQTFGSNPNSFAYYFYQGTSMATPHVAGVAALLIAHGITDPADVRLALEDSATDLGASGWDSTYGWGLLSAYGALTYFDAPPDPGPAPDPVHDVAVTGLAAPANLTQGDIGSIDVTVENQGDVSETVTVSLNDDTDNNLIGNDTFALSAGEVRVLSFNWNTSGASLGDHSLAATVDPVAGETDLADNDMSTSTSVLAPATTTTFHIADISMEIARQGRNYRGRAYVTLVDENGQALGGASVTGNWYLNGAHLESTTATTRSDGSARLQTNRFHANSGDLLRFVVTAASASGYDYQAADNVESENSITIP